MQQLDEFLDLIDLPDYDVDAGGELEDDGDYEEGSANERHAVAEAPLSMEGMPMPPERTQENIELLADEVISRVNHDALHDLAFEVLCARHENEAATFDRDWGNVVDDEH